MFTTAIARARLAPRRCYAQRATALLAFATFAVWLPRHYTLGVNVTASLPVRFFVIHRGERPQRGQYVALRWTGGGPYPAGALFIKILAGVPGDVVRCQAHRFFVNDTLMGVAKTVARSGAPLVPGPTGILPNGHYYVNAPHPDSLDSRYALTGWPTDAQIVGRAYALF